MSNTAEYRSIPDRGERVTHLYPHSSYYAHLSNYRFAPAYCEDKDGLDAGCGAGFGSHYLAAHGTHTVLGIK